MRRFTSKYNDVFKKYLLGILENIPFLANLKDVDEDAFREIVYFMQMKKYKPDEYIFGPGDKITELMLVTEGCLELSGSFESEELAKHRYKSGEQIHASHKLDCSDFYEKYQVGKCDALKRRTEVVPFEKNKAINGYILGYGARAYEEGRPIGDYCHEVVLAELGQGCIINHNVSLVKQITQIQCKALKQTTVYILPIEKIEDIARDHEPFRNKLLSIKEELMPFNAETEENDNKTPLLDYINTEESRGKQLLKKVFMSAIGAWRIKRKTANPDLFEMVPKLQAMEWLDAAGNKTAYKKVVKGEIPYSCVNEDGTLANEESSLSTVAKLHKGHPLMKTVSKITTQLNALTPENMTEIETEQGDQLQALENVANDIEEMNRLLSQVGTLPSINQQPRQQSPPKQDPEQQMYSTDHLNVDPPAYPPQHLPAEVTPEMLFIDVDRVNAAKDERQKKREDRRKAREERKKRKEEEEKNAQRKY